MPVPTDIADLSTTAASNSPAGTESIGTNLDDYLRAIQAILKQTQAQGTDIASATTITLPDNGSAFLVTGTTTITGIADSWTGRQVLLRFAAALQLTHNGSTFALPGSANVTTAAGDCALFVQTGTGAWRCAMYQPADGMPVGVTVTTTVLNQALGTGNVINAGAAGAATESTVKSGATNNAGAIIVSSTPSSGAANGAYVHLYGNDHATGAGTASLVAGSAGDAKVIASSGDVELVAGSGQNILVNNPLLNSSGGAVSVANGLSAYSTGANTALYAIGSDGTSTDRYALVVQAPGGTNRLVVRNDGAFSVPSVYNSTTASAANVYVNSGGTLYRSTSSARYKKDITDYAPGLAELLTLRAVTYTGLNEDTVHAGLIAEEVDAAGLTEFVAYDEQGRPDALEYGNMVALLVNAVKQLAARVAALEGSD